MTAKKTTAKKMTGKGIPLSALALVAALGAGCGVQPSGVITGVPAPTGPAEGVVLFLVSSRHLTVALRATSQQLSPWETLGLLMGGPNAGEQSTGFSTEIPPGVTPLQVSPDPSGPSVVSLSVDVTGLSTVATDQIVCTVRTAMNADRVASSPTVVLVGQGRSRGPQTCPLSS